MKQIFLLLAIFLGCFSLASAQEKSTKSKKNKETKEQNSHFKLLESYTQRVVPGIRGGQSFLKTYFVLIWENKDFPETFFWRGDGGWFPCKIDLAHKVNQDAGTKPGTVPKVDYVTEDVGAENIGKGDTLLLVPIPGGKFAIPKEIPDTAKYTLFYKVDGSKWLHYKVEKITRKKDIIMP